MPIDVHPFLGATDTDSPDHVIGRGIHKEARNVIFRGSRGNKRLENLPSARSWPNSNLPSGVNKSVNSYYDAVNKRIIDFNFNDGGVHGIYVFNTIPKTWQILIEIGSGTDGDILGFTGDLITSVNILYNEQVDGDLLFYIDNFKRPTGFNIDRYLNTPYTVIKRSFIDVAKAPFRTVPQVTYENDTTVTVNNLKNSLYKFRARPVYDDFQKPVLSSGSICALPVNAANPIVDSNTAKNARIAIYVPTGDVDVKKIEIWGTQITDTTLQTASNSDQSDGTLAGYFLIVSLDKTELSISDNDTWRFLFYNDGQYAFGDPKEEILLQDWVPQTAETQELLNGNVLGYANVTEGYDRVNTNISITTNDNFQNPVEIHNGLLFSAFQLGETSDGSGSIIKVILEGAGINDVNGNPTTFDVGYHVIFKVHVFGAFGNDISFSHNNNLPVLTSIPTILGDLGTAAVAQGFTIISQVGNVLTLSYSQDVVLHGATALAGTLGVFEEGQYFTALAYPHQSAYEYAIEYLDTKGRTNGASLSLGGGITTLGDATGLTIPQTTISISNPPPPWARYYHLIRSLNKTYNKHLFWVSNQTFTITNLDNGVKYAYIGISNMADYNANIQAATNTVSYEFQQGDRITFYQRFPVQYPANPAITLPFFDYAIDSVALNPVLNGLIQKGTFIKIVYPVNDINPNFDFTGDNFQCYKILLYNYIKHASSASTQVYYEFGKQFAIGNYGVANPYHIGLTQSQLPDYSQPAIITTSDGDNFWRVRNVPTGAIYYIPAVTAYFTFEYNNLTTNPDNGGVNNTQYQIESQIQINSSILAGNYPQNFDDKYFFLNKLATPQTIRLSGEYTATGDVPLRTDLVCKIVNTDNTVIVQYLVNNFFVAIAAGVGGSYDITFDAFVSIPAGAKMWILAGNRSLSGVSNLSTGSFTIKLSIINNIAIPIIESSFSDKYNIVTNSNSRPTIYDENAKQSTYPVRIRWSLADILNTYINNTNRFYFQDYDEFDASHGSVKRLKARQKELRVFQERRCGRVGVYNKFLRDNQGQNTLVSTDVIITQNNIQYYEGEFGISNQPASLVSSGYADYFSDPIRGCELRLSLDGLINISLLYKTQTWAGSNYPGYLSVTAYQFGGTNSIIGCFNFTKDREGELIRVLQGNESFAFNEAENTWTSFYDYVPDSIVCSENILYMFYGGVLYSIDDPTTYCNYFGMQYKPSITLPFNDKVEAKKNWISINQTANTAWISPLIYTEMNSYGTQRQESNLVDSDFKLLETEWCASFLRDIHSLGGVANGTTLTGGYMVVQFTVADGSKFVYLMPPSVKYNDSALNLKS